MACFDNIVGLSREVCPCEIEGPEGYSTSASGLYIADLDPLSGLEGWGTCDANSAWTLLSNARSNAVIKVKADLAAALTGKLQERAPRFSGGVGEGSGTSNVSTSRAYAGIRLGVNPINGGLLRITKIGTIWPSGATAGNITVSVYDNLNNLVTTRTVAVASNGRHQVTTLETPIELPTHIEYSSSTEYFFVYSHNSANPARANKPRCNCGGFEKYYLARNMQNPAWRDPFATAPWTKWVMPQGWTGDTLTNFHDTAAGDSLNMYGLTLYIDAGCDFSTVYCPGDTFDAARDPLSLSLAYAVQFAAGVFVADKVLTGGKLTRSNTINRELLQAMRGEWITNYNTAIQYIASNANPANNDCLMCKPGIKMSMGLARV